MPTSSFDSIHRDGQCQAWLAIIDLGKHTRSEDVRHQMSALPFERQTRYDDVDMACHHRLLTTHIDSQHRV